MLETDAGADARDQRQCWMLPRSSPEIFKNPRLRLRAGRMAIVLRFIAVLTRLDAGSGIPDPENGSREPCNRTHSPRSPSTVVATDLDALQLRGSAAK
jgi:hypothetical protein